MARYNLIQIGSIYLTSSGLVGGTRCKTEVTGLDGLYHDYVGVTVKAMSGAPKNFPRTNLGEGVEIQIRPQVITSSVLDSIRDAFNTALGADSTIQCVFTGDIDTFDVDCKPLLPKPIDFSGRFRNNFVYDASINLVVVSVN